MYAKSLQSYPTLCNPMDCSPPGLLCPWNSPGQNTGVGSLSLLQGIFPTQGSNPGLLHCRWILYQLSHKGSPRILEWVAYPFLQCIFPTQESNRGLLHYRWILYQLSYQGSPKLLCALSLQSCQTLCNPMDCSLPGSSVLGIFQAQVLEWVAISFSQSC